MYILFAGLVYILLLNMYIQEPFSVHKDSESNMIQHVYSSAIYSTKIIKEYTIIPVYDSIVRLIPYKHHYRKLRRILKDK